jgi:hypothetical protein
MFGFKTFLGNRKHSGPLGTDKYGPDPKNLNKHLSLLHNKNKFNDDEKGSIHTYMGSGGIFQRSIEPAYKSINNYHRGIKSEIERPHLDIPDKSSREQIEHHSTILDSIIDRHTTNHHTHVWRGVGVDMHHHMENIKRGDTFQDKGFVSTSMSPRVASNFADSDRLRKHHIIHINIPTGSKAYGARGREHEVILPRNSKFRYDSKEVHKIPHSQEEFHIHHMTHIPDYK